MQLYNGFSAATYEDSLVIDGFDAQPTAEMCSLRFGPVTKKLEVSNNGGSYEVVGAGFSGSIAAGNNISIVESFGNSVISVIPSPIFTDVSVSGSSVLTAVNKVNAFLGQNVSTGATPLFAGLSVNGPVTTTGLVNGRNMATDGTNLDTVVSRVNQDLKITASPTFSGLTSASAAIGTLTTNSTTSTSINTGTIDANYVRTLNLEGLAGSLTLGTNMTISPGTLIGGRNIGTDGSNLDTLVSRVNQALNTSSSPSFVNISVGSLNLGTYLGYLNQDLKTTASPTFAGLTVGSVNIGTALSYINQDVKTTASPTFVTLSTTTNNTTNTNTTNLNGLGGSLTLGTNMTISPGTLIAGRNIGTDGSNLDTVVSRVNQDLKTSASPSFVNATIGSRDVNTYLGYLNQDLKTTSSPSFTNAFIGGQNAATALGYINQDVRNTSSPAFIGQNIYSTTDANANFFQSLTYSSGTKARSMYYRINSGDAPGGLNRYELYGLNTNYVPGSTGKDGFIKTLGFTFQQALNGSYMNVLDIDRDLITAGTSLSVAGNIAVTGTVDSVDISAFKTDYDSKINQDVRTGASPTFNTIDCEIVRSTGTELYIIGRNNNTAAQSSIRLINKPEATGRCGINIDPWSDNNTYITPTNINQNIMIRNHTTGLGVTPAIYITDCTQLYRPVIMDVGKDTLGGLKVSGSALQFHNGTSWASLTTSTIKSESTKFTINTVSGAVISAISKNSSTLTVMAVNGKRTVRITTAHDYQECEVQLTMNRMSAALPISFTVECNRTNPNKFDLVPCQDYDNYIDGWLSLADGYQFMITATFTSFN